MSDPFKVSVDFVITTDSNQIVKNVGDVSSVQSFKWTQGRKGWTVLKYFEVS